MMTIDETATLGRHRLAAAVWTLTATLGGCSRSETPPDTTLHADLGSHQAGTVDTLQARFTCDWNGPDPVTVEEARTSCGCIEASFPNGTIQPGTRFAAGMQIDTTGKQEHIRESVDLVLSNGRSIRLVATARLSRIFTPDRSQLEAVADAGGHFRLMANFEVHSPERIAARWESPGTTEVQVDLDRRSVHRWSVTITGRVRGRVTTSGRILIGKQDSDRTIGSIPATIMPENGLSPTALWLPVQQIDTGFSCVLRSGATVVPGARKSEDEIWSATCLESGKALKCEVRGDSIRFSRLPADSDLVRIQLRNRQAIMGEVRVFLVQPSG